jgi:hypothetical protein
VDGPRSPASMCHNVVVGERHNGEERSAMQAITVGLDLAKHWFQVHGVDAAGKIVVKRRFRRAEVVSFFRAQEPCLVGMEACATAHHWARELIALGHQVKLMPPAYGKAYVKRNKNDAADSAAICEAVMRPSMRFVPVKDVDQQAVLMMHRARNLLVRQRTMAVNALRAHLAEFGIVAPQGCAMSKAWSQRSKRTKLACRNWRGRSCGSSWRSWTIRRPRSGRLRRGWRSGIATVGSSSSLRLFLASESWGRAQLQPPSAIQACSGLGESSRPGSA